MNLGRKKGANMEPAETTFCPRGNSGADVIPRPSGTRCLWACEPGTLSPADFRCRSATKRGGAAAPPYQVWWNTTDGTYYGCAAPSVFACRCNATRGRSLGI